MGNWSGLVWPILVNAALKSKPEAVNTDPHGSWMIVMKLANPGEAASLLDSTQYTDLAK